MPLKDSKGGLVGEYDVGNVAYEHDYYSGSQVQVMMGDVLLDAAVGIAFSVQQNKTPVYGYANQYYAFVADGQVFVQGSLTIAFKEAGYLLFPIKRFVELNAGSTWSPVREGPKFDEVIKDGMQFESISKIARKRKTLRANVEQVFSWAGDAQSTISGGGGGQAFGDHTKAIKALQAELKEITDWLATHAAPELGPIPPGQTQEIIEKNERKEDIEKELLGYKKTLANDAKQKVVPGSGSQYNKFVTKLGTLSDNDFEDWAEMFEDVLWYGSEKQVPTLRDQLNSGNLKPLTLIEKETFLSHRRPDQYPEVDIWIIYGDTSDDTANHTVKRLLDVSFTGCSTVISPSGEPVYENYSFIARNLV